MSGGGVAVLTNEQIDQAQFHPRDLGYFCCGNVRNKVTSTIFLIAMVVLIIGIAVHSGKTFNASVACISIGVALFVILGVTRKREEDPLSLALLEKVKRQTAANIIAGIMITHPKFLGKFAELPTKHAHLGFTAGNLSFRGALEIRDAYAQQIAPNSYQINKRDVEAINHYCTFVLGQLDVPRNVFEGSKDTIDDLMAQAAVGTPKKAAQSTQLLISVGAPLGDQLNSIDDMSRRVAWLEEHHADKSKK